MTSSQAAPSSFRQRCEDFFFAKEVPYGMALVRIAISAVMLYVMGRRWFFARELFSSDGAPAPLAISYGYYDFLPLLPGNSVIVLYTLMLCLLGMLLIGWKSRLAAFGVFVLFTYFTLQDALSTITKYSVITSHAFLLLSLSQCGAVWSVDRLLELKRQGLARPLRLLGTGRAVEIWPQRLLQILIGVVYLGAAVTKVQTSSYFTGDQMRLWLLTNVNHWNPIGEWMSQFPAMLVPMMLIAIVWELTFIFLVWQKWSRVFVLTLGVIFHAMTTVTLGLIIFPLVSFSIYFAFLRADDVSWWQEKFARTFSRRNWLVKGLRAAQKSALQVCTFLAGQGNRGLVGGVVCLVCAGVFAEQAMDVYGSNHGRSPYELQPMPRSEAQRMLQTNTKIREQDKLLSFDIGPLMVGGLVCESPYRFKPGTKLYLQANLIPPHGDLYLECHMIAPNGMIIDRTMGIGTRDSFRYTFTYYLPQSLDAGEYQFVLRSNTQEIARKTIEVLATASNTPTPEPQD